MLNRWDGIEEFIAVVDNGSFSQAARELSVSKAHISQQVGRLEERLGTRLLHRTTRKISLTEIGESYLLMCRPLLEGLESADAMVSGVQQSVSGRLRISSPHLIGEEILVPAIAQFQALHPKLEIDIDLASHRVDLIAQHYDLAVQLGERKDVNVVNRTLANTRFYMVASPGYIEANGGPGSLEALKTHNCLMFSSRGHTKPWKFTTAGGDTVDVKIKSQWRTNSGHLLRVAARQGLGIAYLPDYYVKEDIKHGNLVTLLPDVKSVDRSLVVIYQHKTYLTQKIRLFVDFLQGYFDQHRALFD